MHERGYRDERRVAPGVTERHTTACARSKGKSRCTCTPTYRATASVGRRGERRKVHATLPTLTEAVQWVASTRGALRAGGALAAPVRTVPVGEAAVQFIVRARSGQALGRGRRPYASNTVDNYRRALELHVVQWPDERFGLPLGDLSVRNVDARTVQALVDGLAASKSAEVARLAAAALAAVLNDAYARGLRDEPAPRVIRPAPNRGRDNYLTLEQSEALLAAALEDDAARRRSLMAPLVAILVGGGLRIEEALGLRWGFQGLDLATEPVRLTVGRANTKSDHGARTLALEADFAAILRQHRLATGRPDDGALVFAREDGRALTRDGRVRSGLRRVARAAGLDAQVLGFNLSPHVLRHSHGTHLEAAGERTSNIAARLGHGDPAFTARRYVHPDRDLSGVVESLAALRARARQ